MKAMMRALWKRLEDEESQRAGTGSLTSIPARLYRPRSKITAAAAAGACRRSAAW